MRVLFTFLLGTGHLHPLVPFAQALAKKKHDVRFAASATMAPQVEAAGFPCFPAGLNYSEIPILIPEWRAETMQARKVLMQNRVLPEIAPKLMLPNLITLAEAWPPDLIVSDNYEFAGRVMAEYLGIPHASVKVFEDNFYPNRFKVVPQMDNLRASVGLSPDPKASMLFRYLYLIPEPPSLRPSSDLLPPVTFHLRRALSDQSGSEKLPPWVANLPGQPVVFATLGTLFNKIPSLLENIVAALRDEPINLILTVGRDRDPLGFGPQPSNVHLERYIPQSLIFPFCDLVVSHGGSGTLFAALEYGLPMVNLPIGADQPENAAHLAKYGAGLIVEPDENMQAGLLMAVRKVLGDQIYRQKARSLQEELRSLPDIEKGVALLEILAREKKPFGKP